MQTISADSKVDGVMCSIRTGGRWVQVVRKWLRGMVAPILVLGASAQTYWPGTQWREATPESQGVDSAALIQMLRVYPTSEGSDSRLG